MSGHENDVVEKSLFSSDNIPPERQYEAWREVISTLFEVKSASGAEGEAFSASLDSYLLDDQVVFTRCDTVAQTFSRNALRTAQDGLDYYLIQTHLSGTQDICRGQKRNTIMPGDLVVMDLADNHWAETSDFNNLTYVVPRHFLAPLLDAPDCQQGRVLKAGNPMVTLVVEHMKTMNRVVDGISCEDAALTIAPTMSLIASALNSSPESIEDGISNIARSTIMRAKLEIESNLHHAGLTVTSLCSKLGMTRTTVFRLFKPYGGVQAYIKDRRLKRCAEALVSQQHKNSRIYEIAYSWGFASEAHFSRAFKSKFGITPSEAREAPNLLKPDREILAENDTGDPYFDIWLTETLKA
ncbi:helix-turn-helix domain-containing protein [Magnetovibrio sp. PR-2]|uniref:helix-turn-helix domain-containing protein n=1 Tax=Magnetovibrio sp. PR-2 TaxID=3120356 RepID=UPI002FCDE7A4